jgi:hypothetical protein
MNQRFRATDAVDPPGPGDEHPPPHDRVRGGRSPMLPAIVGGAAGFLLLLTMTLTVRGAVRGAAERLEKPAAKNETAETKVAIADNTEAPYCTPGFKTVLQRVLNACGLVGG